MTGIGAGFGFGCAVALAGTILGAGLLLPTTSSSPSVSLSLLLLLLDEESFDDDGTLQLFMLFGCVVGPLGATRAWPSLWSEAAAEGCCVA